MRSGSNEVFLRTSFQYSKANLRKKLISYFNECELRAYDLKARKKKDLWTKLIKQKKEHLLQRFSQKRNMLHGHSNSTNLSSHSLQHSSQQIKIQPDDSYYHLNLRNDNLPPSIVNHYSNQTTNSSCSDSLASCSTTNNSLSLTNSSSSTSSTNLQSVMPPINWSELNQSNNYQYQPYQSINITPYSHPCNTQRHTNTLISCIPTQNTCIPYGSHRECTDCMSYMNKMSELLEVNKKLQQENSTLKQLTHQYVAERQEWVNKYN